MKPALLAILLAANATYLSAAEENLRGAQAILEEATQKKIETDPAEDPAQAALKARLEKLKTSKLPPEEAAKEWLAAASASFDQSRQGRGRHFMSQGNYNDLFLALPGPDAWAALARIIKETPAPKANQALLWKILAVVAQALDGNEPAIRESVKNLETALKESGGSRSGFHQGVGEFREWLASMSTNAAQKRQALLDAIAIYQRSTEDSSYSVPPLLSFMTEPEAREILEKLLLLPRTELHFYQSATTTRLARLVATELVPRLTSPPWMLVDRSPEGVNLYEALVKKFPPLDPEALEKVDDPNLLRFQNDYTRQAAVSAYFVGLILLDRPDDARKVLDQLLENEDQMFNLDVDRAVRAQRAKLAAFFQDVLSEKPHLPLWEHFSSLSRESGRAAEFLTAVEKVLAAQPAPEAKTLAQVRQHYVYALLAADKVDEAIVQLKASLDSEDEDEPRKPGRSRETLIVELARLGEALTRTELIDEAVARFQKEKAAPENPYEPMDAYPLAEIISILLESGQPARAEQLLAEGLARSSDGPAPYVASGMPKSTALHQLALTYSKTARHDDVLLLLDKAPWWGVTNLTEFFGRSSIALNYSRDRLHREAEHLVLLAARALASRGQTNDAVHHLETLLNAQPGYDPAYELLADLRQGEALPFLEKLFSYDRFEERPLIWKGIILFRQKKMDEAEQVLRSAIAIDPSDGEQPTPHRMRVYSALSDVLAAKGDQKQAAIYAGAVEAIRQSEHADYLWHAGLVTRALKLYEESLTHFADAYCIQSRLALRYSEMGMDEAAEEHYLRAYELMPDSFGRVESHCFGCEGIFSGDRAQSIAERVFTKLAVAQPDKAQTHYLLGYLRKAQDRFPEAATSFTRAVELDPDHLNAWKELLSLAGEADLPRAQINQATFSILRLDPLGRHSYQSFSAVTDLRGLWVAAEEAIASRPPPPAALMPLPASAERLAEIKQARQKAGDLMRDQFMYMSGMPGFGDHSSPASYLLQTTPLREALQLITMSQYE